MAIAIVVDVVTVTIVVVIVAASVAVIAIIVVVVAFLDVANIVANAVASKIFVWENKNEVILLIVEAANPIMTNVIIHNIHFERTCKQLEVSFKVIP